MTAQDLRSKETGELESELSSLLDEGFQLKMQFGSGQLTKHHLLKRNQRAIARVKTILAEKRSDK